MGSQKQYVGVKKEVKTEEKGENFCQGEGITGRDPRIDQRIHMMYDQDTLKADVSESESESDSIGESTDEDYERLILECPDLTASVKAERKEKEQRHMEKQLRRRVQSGRISYRMVWNRGWRCAFKRMKEVYSSREIILERNRDIEENSSERPRVVVNAALRSMLNDG